VLIRLITRSVSDTHIYSFFVSSEGAGSLQRLSRQPVCRPWRYRL